jgi:hypothetical protein
MGTVQDDTRRANQTVYVRGVIHERVTIYDITPTAFEMTLGYARINAETWVCRIQDDGTWKAMGRKETK